jgi:hypothetical protein
MYAKFLCENLTEIDSLEEIIMDGRILLNMARGIVQWWSLTSIVVNCSNSIKGREYINR